MSQHSHGYLNVGKCCHANAVSWLCFELGKGGGCFKNGVNSKSDKRCHLDPSDPSEISLLKRKKEKKEAGGEKRERKGEREGRRGQLFI